MKRLAQCRNDVNRPQLGRGVYLHRRKLRPAIGDYPAGGCTPEPIHARCNEALAKGRRC